jgi:hypothetical protein
MPVAETSAQSAKRLRKEQPEGVFFVDSELREPLQRAAERCGISRSGLIKKVLKAFLHDQKRFGQL